MSYCANNNEAPSSFGCDCYQFVKRGAANEFFVYVCSQSSQSVCHPIELRTSVCNSRFEQTRIHCGHSVSFVNVNENKLNAELSCHRRRDVHGFSCSAGEIRSANNRRFVVLFHSLPKIARRQQNVVRFVHRWITFVALSTKQIVAMSGNLKARRCLGNKKHLQSLECLP